jgi:DNA polymerase alpha subunit B
VNDVLVLNPGYLAKKQAAGTYSRLTVFPFEKSQLEHFTEGVLNHMANRTKVEIVRI